MSTSAILCCGCADRSPRCDVIASRDAPLTQLRRITTKTTSFAFHSNSVNGHDYNASYWQWAKKNSAYIRRSVLLLFLFFLFSCLSPLVWRRIKFLILSFSFFCRRFLPTSASQCRNAHSVVLPSLFCFCLVMFLAIVTVTVKLCDTTLRWHPVVMRWLTQLTQLWRTYLALTFFNFFIVMTYDTYRRCWFQWICFHSFLIAVLHDAFQYTDVTQFFKTKLFIVKALIWCTCCDRSHWVLVNAISWTSAQLILSGGRWQVDATGIRIDVRRRDLKSVYTSVLVRHAVARRRRHHGSSSSDVH